MWKKSTSRLAIGRLISVKSEVFGSVLVKSAKSSTINFDSTPRGRNEVQKIKPTPHCQTEFHGVHENNNRLSHRELSFWANTVFKNNGS